MSELKVIPVVKDNIKYAPLKEESGDCSKCCLMKVLRGYDEREPRIPKEIMGSNEKPWTVVEIGPSAFFGNNSVEVLDLSDSNIEEISQAAFMNMGHLKTLILPQKEGLLKYVASDVVRNCPMLERMVFPRNDKTWQTEDNGVVYQHEKRSLVFVPRNWKGPFTLIESLISISDCAMDHCKGITAIEVKCSNLMVVRQGAFANTGIESFVIPSSVLVIGENLFAGCTELKSLTFAEPTNLTELPDRFASRCLKLERLIVPKTIERLGKKCLEKAEALKELIFEEGSVLKEIGEDAIWSCRSLEQLELPASLEILHKNNFFGCDILKKVVVAAGNKKFVWEDNILYDYDRKGIRFAAREIGEEFHVPAQVDEIYPNAFFMCKNLKKIELNNVRVIGDYAFGFTRIETVTFPENIERIGTSAFGHCYDLSRVIFSGTSSKLMEIKSCAFQLTNIASVCFPDSIKVLGDRLFSNSQIEKVKWPKNTEEIKRMTFFGCTRLKDLFIVGEKIEISKEGVFDKDCKATVHIMKPDSITKEDLGEKMQMKALDWQEVAAAIYERAKPPTQHVGFGDLLTTKEEWDLTMNTGKEIEFARGGMGSVFLGQRKETMEIAAVKKATDSWEREVSAMSWVGVHPAILGVIGYTNFDEGDAWLITEYMPKGDVVRFTVPQKDGGVKVDPTLASKIVVGTCYACRYLIRCQLLHRDLKPGNILINEDNEPVVADFGSAKFLSDSTPVSDTKLAVTLKYLPPECDFGSGRGFSEKSDVYSWAASMYEVVENKAFARDRGIARKDVQYEPFYNLVEQCTDNEPKERPTFEQILEGLKGKGEGKNPYQVTSEAPNEEEILKYVAKLEAFEREVPAEKCPQVFSD